MKFWKGICLLLLLFQFGQNPLHVKSNPIADTESEAMDFQLKNLCDGIKSDEETKDKCVQCFIGISDPEDEAAVTKCLHHLQQKVADCVKKMVNPINGEINFKTCLSEETEQLEDPMAKEMQVDNETLVEATEHLKALHKLWQEFNTTLALKAMLEFMEENHPQDFEKFAPVIEACEKSTQEITSQAEAMEEDTEHMVDHQASEQSEDVKENYTSEEGNEEQQEEGSNFKRDAEESGKEHHKLRFCDRDATQVHQMTECILQNTVGNAELLQEFKTHIMEINSPIPSQIVKVLLKERDE